MARRHSLTPENVLSKKSVDPVAGQSDLFGWDVAEWRCGRCPFIGHASTEAQLVRMVSGHVCTTEGEQ